MSIDFFPPRFENPCTYTEILMRIGRNLTKNNRIPLDLVRSVLMKIRDNFLDELEIEVMRGDNLPQTELVRDVEIKRAINRSISVKAMMNLIHTKIGHDGSVIVPENHNVPLDVRNFPTSLTILNTCIFRVVYVELTPCWLKTCVPECRFLVCDGDVYTLRHQSWLNDF